LEAIAALRSRHPDLRLIIAGDGTQRTRLQELATQLGVFDICRFLGHCPSVEPFYHAVDLVVQSSDYEGTANTVLEAMAFERPIVATDVGGTAELLQHGVHGLLVKPGDSRALTHAIELAIQDTPSTRRKAELARHRVENELSFQKRMRSVESIYAELMQQFRCSPRKPKGH
jgi:glycosyltransferase involved in cell wall biosynthesis